MERNGNGSRIEGFYRMDHRDRLVALAKHAGLTADEMAELERVTPLPFEVADNMVENAIGVVGLPLAVALNFLINGRDRFVPMAVEEPSIVAAASSAARLVRKAGGFTAEADPSLMIAQIQLMNFGDMERAIAGLRAAEPQ
ncbi:MAG: 3-hydroxy-3-methylglutaryl-CoA reductase, partial [Deltaproteobacteria bacterium]|nr:3-hydroxy-3-methylglutaryl-CoA reductase [Deltaproteobacteria bacterium]